MRLFRRVESPLRGNIYFMNCEVKPQEGVEHHIYLPVIFLDFARPTSKYEVSPLGTNGVILTCFLYEVESNG